MDGSTVSRGDAVYDLVLGAGTVKYMYDTGRGAVQFGGSSGVTKTYTFSTGVMVGAANRSLYWSQPYMVPPPKVRGKYDAYQAVAEKIAALIFEA